MSKAYTKWLKQTIAEMQEHAELFPGDIDAGHGKVLKALRIALASLEAETVGFIARHKETGKFGSYLHPKADWFKNDDYEVMMAYTAPPVSVAVPQCFVRFHEVIKSRHHGRMPEEVQIAFDECAAMIQGTEPVTTANKLLDDFDFDHFNDVVWLESVASNPHMHSLTTSTIAMVALELNRKLADGNSPVIADGWVACSERMPETMVSVLVTGTWFHHAVAFWDGLSWCDLDFEQPVTHWMPLPAAPQQEAE